MSVRNFRKLLEDQWSKGNFVCVGLDSEYSMIPKSLRQVGGTITEIIAGFNRRIVDATRDLVCAYKPNAAFYEMYGVTGLRALHETIQCIHDMAPHVPVILDAKRGDIGSTNVGYADAVFRYLQADAITVHPYLGREALEPFLAYADKGIFVLCRTSNPGSEEFQDLRVSIQFEEAQHMHVRQAAPVSMGPMDCHTTLSNHVAYQVSKVWNKNGNCGLVAGATYPHELENVRRIAPDMPILIPGIGAQGGDIKKTVAAAQDSRFKGIIISSSRSIIFASQGADFAEAARRETERLRDLINQYREAPAHGD